MLTNIWGNKIVTISIEFWSKSFVIYWIWSNFNVKRNRYNEITVCFIWAPWTWLHDFFVRAKEFIMFYHKITTKQLLNKIPHYHEEKTWQSLNSDHQIFRKFTRVQQIIMSVHNLKKFRLGLVADFVIHAYWRLQSEHSLRSWVLAWGQESSLEVRSPP